MIKRLPYIVQAIKTLPSQSPGLPTHGEVWLERLYRTTDAPALKDSSALYALAFASADEYLVWQDAARHRKLVYLSLEISEEAIGFSESGAAFVGPVEWVKDLSDGLA